MLRGGCSCVAVRYETDGAPSNATVCHCVDCRRIVGAVSVEWFSLPRASLHFDGETPAGFRSSPEVLRLFCGTCGTSLTFAHDALPEEIDITIGSLDDPGAVAPNDHVFTRGNPDWLVLSDGLPAHRGSRGEP